MHSAYKKILLSIGTALCLLVLLPAAAMASTDLILQDCNDDGSLGGKYSKSDLQSALGNIPSDLAQYSDCESVINQALLNLLNKKSKDGGSGGGVGGRNAAISSAKRKQISREVEKAAAISPAAKIAAPAGAAITRADGQTLSSTSAPGIPNALIVAVIGMLLLFAADLAGRAGKIPGVKKILPGNGSRRGASKS